jgi:hypothetical protein
MEVKQQPMGGSSVAHRDFKEMRFLAGMSRQADIVGRDMAQEVGRLRFEEAIPDLRREP